MTMSSVELVQGLLEMVHLRVAELPTTKPVIPEVGEEAVVMVAVPDTTVQVPLPDVGVFPARVVAVTLHKLWSVLAVAVVGGVDTLITTSSVELVQAPLAIVHLKVAELPTTSPIIPELGELALEMVAVPETTDQVPLPAVGVFPARVLVVTLHKL